MRKFAALFLIFLILFLGFCLIFARTWIVAEFGELNFEQILFHLQFPLAGTDHKILWNFYTKVIVPSLILSVSIAFFSQKLLPFFSSHTLIFKGALAVIILGVALINIDNTFRVVKYVKNTKKQEFSTFYEKNYAKFDLNQTAQNSQNLNNLIVIFVESLESSFAYFPAQNRQTNTQDMIPKLSKFARGGVNFSSDDEFGGFTQLGHGVAWTIAGIVAQMCAVPTTLPFGSHQFFNSHFLDGAVCVSDILGDLGYKQTFLQGSNADYTSKRHFFKTHGISVIDELELEKMGLDLKSNEGLWGFRDSVVFNEAKKLVSTAKSPFALYILSVDTHAHTDEENTFIDPKFCSDINNEKPINPFICADRIIADFVEFVAKSEIGKDTTIVILGDHLSMDQYYRLFPGNLSKERRVFNAFLNAKFGEFDENLTKNRELSHFDMAPLILSSVGLEVREFGLGRNPFFGKTLLELKGSDYLNSKIKQKSKFYDNLWLPKE